MCIARFIMFYRAIFYLRIVRVLVQQQALCFTNEFYFFICTQNGNYVELFFKVSTSKTLPIFRVRFHFDFPVFFPAQNINTYKLSPCWIRCFLRFLYLFIDPLPFYSLFGLSLLYKQPK